MRFTIISPFRGDRSYLVTLLFMLFITRSSYATTIIPFVNIGEMALASDAVVLAKVQDVYQYIENQEGHIRIRFAVEQQIKGPLFTASTFELESASGFNGDLYFEMSGDMTYEAGRSYLIFLRQLWQAPYWEPVLQAYGIFEKVTLEKKNYLVPSSEGRQIIPYERPDGRMVEPLLAYEMEKLLSLLQEVVAKQKKWDTQTIRLVSELNTRLLSITASPSHCNFFGSRWLDFPDTVLPVYAEDDGDATIANYSLRVSNAVTLLRNNYNDINLNYSGTTNYTPNCSAGGGNAYSAGSGFFNALSGDRWILVMFDDPCDQLENLIIEVTEFSFSCEGVMARGGLYGYIPGHTYDGVNKNDGAYGYVIVNERVGDCLLGNTVDYEYLLAHEITHSLGFNHINESDGVANMNPFCCSNITSLDIQCSEYFYGGAFLPVELTQFKAKKEYDGLWLDWQTAWEENNSRFVVERSTDGQHFSSIGTVPSRGTADFVQAYRFLDSKPLVGVNYYRLQQIDFDGTATSSEVLSVFWEAGPLTLSIYPNPITQGELFMYLVTTRTGDFEVSLYHIDGKALKRQYFPVDKGENRVSMEIHDLPSGIYLVKGILEGQAICQRLVIEN